MGNILEEASPLLLQVAGANGMAPLLHCPQEQGRSLGDV